MATRELGERVECELWERQGGREVELGTAAMEEKLGAAGEWVELPNFVFARAMSLNNHRAHRFSE
jgi:hypothetical protein